MPDAFPPPQRSHDDKLLAALSYFWVLSLLILAWKRNDPFVAGHAKQGLVLFVLFLIALPLGVVGGFINVAVFVLIIVGFWRALEGATWRMPILGALAEKIRLG